MTGALDGLRVVDFGQYLAGPLVAQMLGDCGADVVRIDPPGGPRWSQPANAVLQRGKRSVVLDLKRPPHLATAREHRMRTGEGQLVSASLSQSGALFQVPYMLAYRGKTWDNDEAGGQLCRGLGPLEGFFEPATNGSLWPHATHRNWPRSRASQASSMNLPIASRNCPRRPGSSS